jgi:hypothetical protein
MERKKHYIYKIQSLLFPSRFYIGSTARWASRKSAHRNALRNNMHCNPKLQNHYNKYGKDDLVFTLIEKHEFISGSYLLEREQFFLDAMKPWFNIARIASASPGGRLSKEIIKKRKGRKHSEETKIRMSEARMGIKFSEEHIENLRKSHLGNKCHLGHKLSDESKRKIGEANKGKRHTDEFRLQKSLFFKSIKRTEEWIDNWRKSRIGHVVSQETRDKIGNANRGKKRKQK